MTKKDPSLAELLGILGFFAPIIYFLWSIRLKFSHLELVPSISPINRITIFFIDSILILIIVVYIIPLIALILITLHYRWRPSSISSQIKKFKRGLIRVVYYGIMDYTINNIMGILILFCMLCSLILIEKPLASRAFLILFSFYMIYSIPPLCDKYKKCKSFISHFRKRLTKCEILKIRKLIIYSKMILAIPTILIIGYILINLIFYSTSEIQVELNKEFYSLDEDVYIKITPKSILKRPEIIEVSYSNENLILENRSNKPYKDAPVYLIINKSILKKEPYNSFLIISYNFGRGLFFIPAPKHGYHVVYIPVFDKLLPQANI